MFRGIFLFFLILPCAVPAQIGIGGGCTGSIGANIFKKGDFGTGFANILPVDPRLAPGYAYQFNPPPNDGFYTIANNTSTWGSFAQTSWIKTGDNSPDPYGYFMVVNASLQPGLFYLDTVEVCGNTNYLFSADVISMNLPAVSAGFIRPNISFLVDGKEVYSSGNVPIDGQWHSYGFALRTAPGANKLILALRNNAPGGNGNDLGLDNISFRPCGPKITARDTILYRRDSTALLSAQVQDSVYGDPRYQWQVSTDDGLTWKDVPGANDTTLAVPKAKHGTRYRILVGDGLAQLGNPSCRVESKSILVREDAYRDTFRVAICPGGAYEAFGKQLREPGEYEFFFPSNFQGDRIVTIYVRIEDLSGFRIAGPDKLCRGDTATLRAGAFGSVVWSTGEVGESIRVTRPGAYSVVVSSIFGCSASDTLELAEVALEARAEAQAPSCRDARDGKILFSGFSGGTPPYRFGIAAAAMGAAPEVAGLGPGLYRARVEEAGGCAREFPLSLENPPVFALDSKDTAFTISLGERVRLSAESEQAIVAYHWSPESLLSCVDCPDPFVSPDSSATFVLKAYNAGGCTATKTVRVQVLPVRKVYAPTAFSPNGDGVNEEFSLLSGRGVLRVLSFQIYDRQGGMVFSAVDAESGSPSLRWDGRLGQAELPARTYVWTAVLRFTDGTTERLTGEVVLLR